ncbi:MAG: PEP-CTERM sorting domain-containing protein [Phycisphaerae bacterium]|nr:PEP-CTERM sorting domain-containing protein [Phycisphaerae bacterium]
MKNKITKWTLAAFLIAASVIPVAAMPVGGSLIASNSDTISLGGSTATVDSYVYQYSANQYIYSYQIVSASPAPISFFSVALDSGMTATSASIDSNPFAGWVDPVFWQIINSGGTQSVNYMYNALANSQTSSLMWFSSPDAPGMGTASVFGSLSGVPHYSEGDVYAPAPEPATLALLGIGIGIAYKRNRNRV